MSVSIYDPTAARDLFELRQYIHTTISQSRPVDMANRLDVIGGWLDRIVFPNKELFQVTLNIVRFNVRVNPDTTQIGVCVGVLELLLQALPADAC